MTNRKEREISFKSLLMGLFLGLIFAVSNTYLGLRIGTTISASIPAVVVSIAFFKLFRKKVSILEHNIVQTIASVGEALAAGVIFTVPALHILGAPLSALNMILLTLLGGMLGILFMIPMRRYVIIKEHDVLPFPEGTACAEILKMSTKEAKYGFCALIGVVLGGLYKILTAFKLLLDSLLFNVSFLKGALFSMDLSPALLGVGYIIGPRISALMFAGGMTAWWVLIPLIMQLDHSATAALPNELWEKYIRYIGAGAVGAGGVLSLAKMIPIAAKTIHSGIKEIFGRGEVITDRKDLDISLKWLILGSVMIILFLWIYPPLHMNFVTILSLTLIGYFFTGITSITVGLVGSSSSPASGMIITTLLITSLILVFLGWTERVYLISVVIMSILVSVAITLASATSQDLKTGFLVGATPRMQQIAEMIGLVIPSVAIFYTLSLLDKTYGFGTPELPAPQAMLIAMIAEGVMTGNLPVALVLIGAVLGVALWLCRLPVLPYALGLYLPLSLSSATFLGGIFSLMSPKKSFDEKGTLLASGLVAGDACLGIIITALAFFGLLPQSPFSVGPVISFLLFIGLGMLFVWTHRKNFSSKGDLC